jgi:hypothetical protein
LSNLEVARRQSAEQERKAAELLNDVDGRRVRHAAEQRSLKQKIGHRHDVVVTNALFADQVPQLRFAGAGAADELDDHASSR